jgi:diguanylate cyclase (GGDEF)-like protein/PAS domain S-box-containing protein
MIKSHVTLPKYRTTMFWVSALLVLYVVSRYNYLLFHSFADGVSIVIAACVFTIIWNGRRIVDNDYFLYVGIAFLFFAFWDLMHLLGNKNMGVFPKYGNLGPALYIVSRYILAISLIIAPLFINRKLNTTLMYAAYSLITLLVLLSIFYWHIFPVCIVDGVGLTPFKVVSDYIICLILLGSIGLLLINRRSFDSRVLRLIVSSVILSIATGLAFTLYADPFGIMNATGHFFQIASFYMIYLAFIETSLTKPQDILYQKLKQNEEKLAENLKQLNDINAELKQEIAERKRAEVALRESENQYHSLFENMLDGFAYCKMLYDEQVRPVDFVYLDVNTAFKQLTGLKDVVGKKVTEVIPGIKELNPELFESYGRVALTGKPEKFEIDFKPLAKSLSISVYSPAKEYFVAVFDDITEQKLYEEKLEHFAIHDQLTGLLNRHSLEEMLSRTIAKAKRGKVSSLLYMDLDNFKEVNDSVGHAVGDEVLITLAGLFKDAVRTEDIVFRLGGDEFAVLLDGMASRESLTAAGRLRATVEGHNFDFEGRVFPLSLSIGLIEIDGALTTGELLSQADAAMYRAKAQGKNRVVVA